MKELDVEQLLRSERGRPGFTDDARAGLWKGIEAAVGPLAGAGLAPDPAKPPVNTPPSPPTAPAAAVAQGASQLAAWKLAALLGVVALGAGAIGAAAHARFAEPRVVTVERIVERPVAALPSPAQLPSPAPLPSPAAPERSATALSTSAAAATVGTAVPRASAAAAASTASSPRDPALARERTMLDMARTALSRGDTTTALGTLDEHARDFPRSQLGEEREVLAIQALAGAGRLPEARKRAAAFRANYPKSALLPIVEESTQ